MVIRHLRIVCGLAICSASLLTGCVTEPGRSDRPALWSSIKTKESDELPPLRNPARLSVAYGKVQEQRGQFSVARKHYEMALAEDSKSVDAIVGIARLDQYAGRIAEAESGFRRALKLDPENPHVNESIAMFYASQNRWQEAVASLRKALKADPNNADYQKKLAISLAKTGNLGAAYQQFLITVGEAEAHYYMGLILMERGQQSAAAQQFQLALMHAPDMDAARAKLAELNNGSSRETYANRKTPPEMSGAIRSVGHTAPPNTDGYLRQPPNSSNGNQPDHHIVITPGPKQSQKSITTRRPTSGAGGYHGQSNSAKTIPQWSNQHPSP